MCVCSTILLNCCVNCGSFLLCCLVLAAFNAPDRGTNTARQLQPIPCFVPNAFCRLPNIAQSVFSDKTFRDTWSRLLSSFYLCEPPKSMLHFQISVGYFLWTSLLIKYISYQRHRARKTAWTRLLKSAPRGISHIQRV